MRDYYTITELTREFDISTRTIRFYEDEGLIAPIRRGRTRLFRHSDRQLLKMILRGKRLGFSIAEIREIMGMYRTPPGEAGSCARSSAASASAAPNSSRSAAISRISCRNSIRPRKRASRAWPTRHLATS